MMIRISAIICTYNRFGYLKKAIQSLAEQTLPKEQYEIIVVDNGSTDNTVAVVEGFKAFENLRYIHEPMPGLSQARNTGWRNAKGEYIAYLDDDAIAGLEWLERIVTAFDTVNPRPGSVGGKITLIWETMRPTWLSNELELPLGHIDWGDSSKFLIQDHEFLAGSNVAYRREILVTLGGFSTCLGLKGNKILLGEELLLSDLLRKQNITVYYDPEIGVQHHVLPGRLAKGWFYNRYFGGGVSNIILKFVETFPKRARRYYVSKAFADILRIMKHPTIPIVTLLQDNSDIQVARKCKLYLQIGQIWAELAIGFGRIRSE